MQQDHAALFSARFHSPILDQKRRQSVRGKTTAVAVILAFLMLVWIPVDIAVLGWPGSLPIVTARTISTVALAFCFRRSVYNPGIRLSVFLLLAIPMAFFWYANSILGLFPWAPRTAFAESAYAHFPILIAMLLGFFPLTLAEGAFMAILLIALSAVAACQPGSPANKLLDDGTLWILIVSAGLSVLAGMSNLSFMAQLVHHTTHDALTGLLKREQGLLLMETLFAASERTGSPISILFADLDNFKNVNDAYGHEAGDQVLKSAAALLQASLRRQDIAIRWGGEEFLIVMPGTSSEDVKPYLNRLNLTGIGSRPDGAPQTASIGIAERMGDNIDTVKAMIALADERMYAAKKSGRNAVAMKGAAFPFVSAGSDRSHGE